MDTFLIVVTTELLTAFQIYPLQTDHVLRHENERQIEFSCFFLKFFHQPSSPITYQ